MRFFKQFFISVFFISVFCSYSQNKSEGVKYQRNGDKSVTFSYKKNTPGSLFVVLKFLDLVNTSHGLVRKSVSGYEKELVTLYPTRPNEHIGFSYSYRTVQGDINAKPDFQFKYVLPFKKGKTVKVKSLKYLGKLYGNTEPKNWTSFQFLVEPNDTVCAVRKGIVVKIKGGNLPNTSKEHSYKNKSNAIYVEHEDGTIANYDVLKNNSFLVKVGDVVYPSTPLALAGTYDSEENSQLRLSIYYLNDSLKNLDLDSKNKEQLKNRTHLHDYINPMFYVYGDKVLKLKSDAFYTVYYNDALIEAEMSRREIKRRHK